MTLAEERELEIIKGGLTYKKGDAHTLSPHPVDCRSSFSPQ